MALSAYLTLVGQKQGAINGSVTEKAHENSILVHSYDNLVTSPRDQTSGLPTGKRVHQPITITKELDRSSVPLWNALVTNENMTTWQLKFWLTTSIETSTQIYTVSLTNAIVTSIREYRADSVAQANASGAALQDVTFTYQKIQWTWNDGGLTATDDWLAKA
jgi:type VI secretion system secreted protein Hcp